MNLTAAIVLPALGLLEAPAELTGFTAVHTALAYTLAGMFVTALTMHRSGRDDSMLPSAHHLFESLSDPVFITDARGRVSDLNPAGIRMLGKSREACLGVPLVRLLPSLDTARDAGSADAVSATLDWPVADGKVQRYLVRVSPLHDGAAPRGSAFILHDVTPLLEEILMQQRAAAAAEAAGRMSNEFLAVVSHEIRTPMQAVVGMTGLLLGTELTDEQRDYVDTIRSSGDSMLAIVNNVLDFSKIEAGQIELEREPFDPLAAVEDTLTIFAGQAAMKNLELAYLADQGAPVTVVGDVTRFRQVLTNLVGNAVKFTDRGEVTISVGSRSEGAQIRLHVRVRDTGIGIPVDRMDKLFVSFSQADVSTTRRYGGTGLGLAICRRLCEIMGGEVWAESHAGAGSTFHFTVITEPDPTPRPAHATPNTLAERRTLIVDDSPASREMLSSTLRSWGMQVEAVESGWTALQILESSPPFDVVLIDMRMPVMDGEACARRIRAMRHQRQPRLVMMVALTDGGVRTRAAELGLDSVIVKPVKRSQLRGALSDIFAAREPANSRFGVPAPAVLGAKPSSKAVLLADDNRVGQRVTHALLRRLGYQADVVASGAEVLTALQAKPYDIVLMDVYMPEMDGLTTTREIRSGHVADRQPYVIALTASAAEGDKQECLNAGMDDYLSKPVTIADLRAALERADKSSGDEY